VNRDLAAEPAVATSQICRFLVLHKELDADDGELTRTRKVRRRIIAARYQPLIDAFYSSRRTGHIETEITFEDGRKGRMRAELAIRDVATTLPMLEPAALRKPPPQPSPVDTGEEGARVSGKVGAGIGAGR